MTTVKLKPWANAVHIGSIEGLSTLTRYIDPANNSNKYRRFITLVTPGELPLLVTQTGRWTHLTSSGNWSGGTVKHKGQVTKTSWARMGQAHVAAHRSVVRQKKADYLVESSHEDKSLSDGEKLDLLRRAQLVESSMQPQATPPTTPIWPPPSATPVDDPGDSLAAQLTTLLQKASDETVDPFDLFAEVAMIRNAIDEREALIDSWRGDLALANEQIMGRI